MKIWVAKKILNGITNKVMKAREIKRLRDYVEKDNELDIQMKQMHKIVSKQGKYIEELEKDVAILKKDSHPPVEGLEDRLNKLEKRR
jgi:hypothetical protein